jgi:hypothetical protein
VQIQRQVNGLQNLLKVEAMLIWGMRERNEGRCLGFHFEKLRTLQYHELRRKDVESLKKQNFLQGIKVLFCFSFCFCVVVGLVLNSGLPTCKAGALLLEPQYMAFFSCILLAKAGLEPSSSSSLPPK